jgi:hypothetical protein
MRRLERKGLLVKVEEQFGRGRTIKYRIDLQAGTLRERRKKGAIVVSPISREFGFGKGEIPQGERVKSDAIKGAIAIAPESSNRLRASVKQLPLPPLSEGDISAIWKKVCEHLKDDLSAAFVKTPHFHECAYDKYFRDAWLMEIRNDIAVLDSDQPELLEEGVQKFQRRLRDTFRGVVYSIRPIRVRLRDRSADNASQSTGDTF